MRFSLARTLAVVAPALLLATAFTLAACDATSVPNDRDNLDPGLVAGTYIGTAELGAQPASRFTMTMDVPAAAPEGVAASAVGQLEVSGSILRNGETFALSGSGEFVYPSVTVNAKSPALGDGEDSFTFDLTTDASGSVLQGTVNGTAIKLDRQR
ncbi:MAG: hypothetical protein AAF809_06430 [Bacteroidota bacterium]